MTNQGVNFQLPSGGQFSVAVDNLRRLVSALILDKFLVMRDFLLWDRPLVPNSAQ
jgi:hypothetical protein